MAQSLRLAKDMPILELIIIDKSEALARLLEYCEPSI